MGNDVNASMYRNSTAIPVNTGNEDIFLQKGKLPSQDRSKCDY